VACAAQHPARAGRLRRPLTRRVVPYLGLTLSDDDSRDMDPRTQVRESYNRIAAAYLSSRRRDSPDVALLDDLVARLPPRARVLDAGSSSPPVPASSESTLPRYSSASPSITCPQEFGFAPTSSHCRSLMRPSTRYARTTPSFTSHGNNTPAFWMALRVCYGPVGWPYFALALWTFLPGRSSTMMRRCTGATTLQRRAFRS